MDSSLIVGGGLAVLGSKDLLNRLLGPTADYLGGEVKQFVEKCNVNLDRIFASAVRRLGKDLNAPGVVAPRILKEILNEGRFCEDELSAEYYGGLLASSRAKGLDDTLLPYLSLLRNLSTHQIRLHYIVYSLLHKFFQDDVLEYPRLTIASGCADVRIQIEGTELLEALAHGLPETKIDVFERVHMGLSYRQLLTIVESTATFDIYQPTPDGADFFMMANGKRGFLCEFFEYDLQLPAAPFQMPKTFLISIERTSSPETEKPIG